MAGLHAVTADFPNIAAVASTFRHFFFRFSVFFFVVVWS
jgi:hypothetical protein